jgi:putative spermidine/putrescine transport system permease protein
MRAAATGRRFPPSVLLALPALIVFAAFWLLPVARLTAVGASGTRGIANYWAVLVDPGYRRSLLATVLLSIAVTAAALVVSGFTGFFLQRERFPGRTLLVALLSFPLAFPGVVVGFLVILLAGRQGLLGTLTEWLTGDRLVFAYGMAGLFVGYLYFSIPRTILTVMSNTEKLDRSLEEAARTLGASPARVLRDVILPGLAPAIVSAGAVCFATSMGAFGTAFTLATQINVLPITIYNEFTNYANFAVAASLSLVLGFVTWATLALARTLAGAQAAAAA